MTGVPKSQQPVTLLNESPVRVIYMASGEDGKPCYVV